MRVMLLLAIALGCGSALSAQEVEQPGAQRAEPEEHEEGPPRFEAELVASTIFQGARLAVRSSSPLTFESHFFGVETNEIGMVGLAWTFVHGGWRVVPGVAWAFGSENRPAPVVTLRWSYEHERWLSQGLWVQSLRPYVPDHVEDHFEEHQGGGEAVVRHAGILDGAHASAVVGPWELGALVEHIRYREEREWKGGARVAWRAGHGLKIVGQALGPGAEVRGGLMWER